MNKPNDHLQTLQEIRSLMERSSRFISLSGLSGVTAGLFALAGAAAVYLYLGMSPFEDKFTYYEAARQVEKWGMDHLTFFILDATLVLLGALAGGIYFTTRKAKRKGQPIWDALTQRLVLHLAIPLIAGGIFILALLKYGLVELIAPVTLIFYGLALLNASKYTLRDIQYLGISELILGLTGLFFPGFGLELWALGFGILHIVYGVLMYTKYEK